MTHTHNIPWFLGIDLGTGSCKSVIIDEQARIFGIGAGGYSDTGHQEQWQEQPPQLLVKGVIAAVREAINQAGVNPQACAGLSLGGALHSLMAVDHDGRPLTGVTTWADGRTMGQAKAVRKQDFARDLYKESGCPAHGLYPLYKVIWWREEHPDIFERASRFISAKEYVLEQLTGEYAVDYAVASGSGLLNIHSLQWNERSLELGGIGPDRLSPLYSPRHVFPGLKPELAQQMGLPPQTPVVLGASDAVNSSIGAGTTQSWQATCMIGTSGAYRVIAPKPMLDEKSRNFCYVMDEKHWLVGGAVNNGGVALSWLRDMFNQAFSVSSSEAHLSFEDILTLAGQAETGAGGLLFLPLFAGERSPHWNLNARALLFGMTLKHEAKHLALALLEGIALWFKSLDEILTDMGMEIRQVRASGGFTKSPLWLQVMANALNKELVVPACGETSAFGAALWAMGTAGLQHNLEKAGDVVALGQSYEPNAGDTAVYERLYPIFKELYQSSTKTFERIADVQSDLLM
jgi:gluconokinase